MNRSTRLVVTTALLVALTTVACGTTDESTGVTDESTGATDEAAASGLAASEATAEASDTGASGDTSTFVIEIWADNWAAVYVDGQLIGEDSVPITTERSFNAETFGFEAAYPFTIGIEAKDFKETDSGIEYIGEPNQQMGDGGLIAQVTDTTTGDVVAVTNADWSVLVVHRAPLDPSCADDTDPDASCEYEISETPTGWADADFDHSGWNFATEWSAAEVDPKDGYLEITWDASAQLIWGQDLEVDNTVLARMTVTS